MVYSYDKIKQEVEKVLSAYDFSKVKKTQFSVDGLTLEPKEGKHRILINLYKLAKRGFYKVQVSVVRDPSLNYESGNLDLVFQPKSLNAKEAFNLADQLVSDLWKKGYACSLDGIAGLPKWFRGEHLGLKS